VKRDDRQEYERVKDWRSKIHVITGEAAEAANSMFAGDVDEQLNQTKRRTGSLILGSIIPDRPIRLD
jgi:hypothetical protein